MKKNRESNIELLRIVLMLMIIMHHFIVHGCGLSKLSTDSFTGISLERNAILIFINTFCIIGVNCFIFISGYYSIKPKIKTFISLLVQTTVLSASLFLFYNLFYNPTDFSLLKFFYSFFPLIVPTWWFIISYICLYLLSPIINKGIEHCSRKTLISICVIFLVLFFSSGFRGDNLFTETGYNQFTLLIIYIIARCCKVLALEIKKAKLLYLISFTVNFILVSVFFY